MPRPPANAAQLAYEAILDAILLGKLRPNEPLREKILQNQFGFGRAPIREALARLTFEGLAITSENHGLCVRHLDAQGLQAMFAIRLSMEPLVV